MKKYLFKWQHKGKSGSFIYEWYKGMPSARWIANNMGDVEYVDTGKLCNHYLNIEDKEY